ncbi:hypothetical protein A3K34_00915 [candidate division WWE3 bacterium RIFOXYC1_FULL_40_10]|uniref:PDZ domain-containing protein n=1 Tax=candidate division WWE3 bacterium RIFOXYA2_FULL_46_9 TaxID=1802636 RepID=A0A1F4W259_UNCKA|nr:MAG: hypothetical protein A3K58_00915 [candidate division WWE3 bacterium RIFOXYB1_FULL_40_22]OGC61435.1 MAG: hypothetical protein A3K37_00915 [candidate division WWE3 bacterium RIFOXYA1_FULL_40_11]OGC63368.1 MAG: hypothetical protein A2264_01390 [candidate division WWE3 bacterium RIFOXYA2_FULL_46_9]OGC64436.1 MAG: hypothetical protein A2326_00190 [candidate division WWE3 bacterium RIFOXYB2_FULL_41_6]OGC65818.1 MAG: hypothetical protein A3K34_00915 [candidate division WWE3 bacterium RIFOXYC1_
MSPFEKFQKYLLSLLIAVSFFYGGYYIGRRGFQIELKKSPPQIEFVNKNPTEKSVDFSLFWEVWDIVNNKYLERPIDAQKMIYGAIEGMVSSLGDSHTEFLPPQLNQSFDDSLNGKYQGIGAELDVKDGQLIVVSPLDGSPALSAGLKPGDKILAIGEDTTYGLGVTEAVYKIRGDAGTVVELTIQTNDDKPRKMNITRGVISVASVKWEDKGEGTVYIRISRFGGDTDTAWDKAVAEINTKVTELDVIVIDLRGNPGGYLQSAVHIAGEFFRNKPVLYEENAAGEQIPLNTKRVGNFQKVPALYVLIDAGSASSSEILAAALRDNTGAILIGENSFGKGTVQEPIEFGDKSSVHVTVAKWLTPKKEWVHKIGIKPEFVVERTNEDFDKGQDPQLDKALELAQEI